MSRDFTLIYYSIPEDFDDLEQPNAFGISKSVADITLRDIKLSFPLEGTYHFRFKYLHNKIPVWMDLNNDEAHIPLFSGKVIAKVTRISWDSSSSPPPRPSPVKQSPHVKQSPQVSQPSQMQPAPQPQVSQRKEMDIFDSREEARAPAPTSSDYDLLFSH
mmetsp:Transcript_9341/g.17932  ORF Transcript_9341/g.17932 Transcript_9341/m.17932 type:complete len:160 (-) Transcript_9341:3829-4308(-)